MRTIMVYFILEVSLFVFNDKNERKPYSRYWYPRKISSGCLWKCLVICWLLYNPFWFSFHLSYLCVITSNVNCLIVVILINSFVFISWRFTNFVYLPPSQFYFFNLNIFVCPGYCVLRNGIPKPITWFKNQEDSNLNNHCSQSLKTHR